MFRGASLKLYVQSCVLSLCLFVFYEVHLVAFADEPLNWSAVVLFIHHMLHILKPHFHYYPIKIIYICLLRLIPLECVDMSPCRPQRAYNSVYNKMTGLFVYILQDTCEVGDHEMCGPDGLHLFLTYSGETSFYPLAHAPSLV